MSHRADDDGGGVSTPVERVLVPVSHSSTIRATVEYAVEQVLPGATTESPGLVRFVYVHSPETAQVDPGNAGTQSREDAEELLDRAEVWAREDAGKQFEAIAVETAHLGTDEYLFSPDDFAHTLGRDAAEHGIERIVLDPEYDPGAGAPFLRPLEVELTRDRGLTVEEAPVEPRARRAPLVRRSTPLQLGVLFGLAFVFYQALAGAITLFDFVTGAMSATIVAVALSRVTFTRDPTWQTPVRVARMALYVPYLLFEIVKANILIAAVILHPRLPVEPRLTAVRPAVWGGLPVTTLANSITLTPGTLTVRVNGPTLIVHTLVPAAREDLFDGSLERAVRFLFYGRRAMRIESPRERGATDVLQPSGEKTTGTGDEAAESGGEPE